MSQNTYPNPFAGFLKLCAYQNVANGHQDKRDKEANWCDANQVIVVRFDAEETVALFG